MKAFLAMALLSVSLAVPANACVTECVQLATIRPVAAFEEQPEGGSVSWWVAVVPGTETIVGHPDGYVVYRLVLRDADGTFHQDPPVKAGTEYYHEGDQAYTFVDELYEPGSVTVYFVRGFIDLDEGPPSNPVGNYPPCNWGSAGTEEPYLELHPECLVPDT